MVGILSAIPHRGWDSNITLMPAAENDSQPQCIVGLLIICSCGFFYFWLKYVGGSIGEVFV